MTTHLDATLDFLGRRLAAQKAAERLGLGCYVANGQMVVLQGEPEDGRWRLDTKRLSRPATEEEVVLWDRLVRCEGAW